MVSPALPVEPLDIITHAAVEEKAKLRRHFGRFDIFFFLICTIVGLDTLGTVAGFGGQGFFWLIFLAAVFFVPYALLTAELGSTFREEGGSYIWTKLALGRFVGGVNSVLYWLSNPIWLGGTLTITAVTVLQDFFVPDLNTAGRYVFALAFIWFATWAAILSFGVGKWIPTIGAWGRILLLSTFTITVLIYAAKNGVHGFGLGDFSPTLAVGLSALPVLFFNFVGFELPNAAGDEMKNAKQDVPYTVKRATIVAILAYGLPVLSILLVLPTDQVTSLGGFINAIKTVFTVYGGSIDAKGVPTLTGAGQVLGDLAAAGFIWTLLSSGTTWIMGADRAQAVAAYDGAGPRWMGVFSRRWGTPVAVNLLSGGFATIMFVLADRLTDGDSAKYFSAALSLAISTTTLSYLAIFPSLYLLRRKFPQVERPYGVPGGDRGALWISIVTTFWALLASISLLWPGFLTTWDDALPKAFAGQRLSYEVSQLLPLALFLAIGVLFYVLGAPTRRDQATVLDLAAAEAAAAALDD
jgi:glutamate:GABA antiporter